MRKKNFFYVFVKIFLYFMDKAPQKLRKEKTFLQIACELLCFHRFPGRRFGAEFREFDCPIVR